MSSDHKRRILLAEDDEDDYILIRDVLEEIAAAEDLVWVQDGEELLHHLRERLEAEEGGELPDLILLDLNMPRKDGRTALSEIKKDPALRSIPVVILTTSDSETDISATYDLGANSYLMKPAGFGEFRDTMRVVIDYWFNTVNLPPHEAGRHVGGARAK